MCVKSACPICFVIGVASVLLLLKRATRNPPARYVAAAPAPLLLVSAGKSFSADCLFALILRVPEKFFFFSSPASVVVVVVWTKEATVTRSLLRVFVSNARSVRDDDKRGRIGAPRSAQLM